MRPVSITFVLRKRIPDTALARHGPADADATRLIPLHHRKAAPIARGRFRPEPRDNTKRLRINDLIRISPIRLIDENDNPVGVVDVEDAKRMAKDAGLDLVEVAPKGEPPVCKIMDYGKWKYAQKKKEQKARSHAKQSELKGMRLRPKIDIHDLGIKMSKAREFLLDGDKVQFTMLFRGREMAHRNLGLTSMRKICEELSDIAKVESEPKMMGRRATMVLAPDKAAAAASAKADSNKAADKPAVKEDTPAA